MKYENIVKGTFISRPNRFLANVEIGDTVEVCHVKNTGRCKELLVPDANVYLEKNNNPSRKTRYSLITVQKGTRLINMDSQAPNKVVYEWLQKGNLFPKATLIRPETKYKNSRFDFYIEDADRQIFMEVKGVTLETDNVVQFPDAPTERGIKHIHELCEARKEGYEAYVLFVIQMKGVDHFTPNRENHKEFADALLLANECGVSIKAYDCQITEDTIYLDKEVKVVL